MGSRGCRRYAVATLKGGWSSEDDAALSSLVAVHGEGCWSMIARELNKLKGMDKGRIGKQCRERYLTHLKADLKKDAWTEDEEITLVEAHKKHGNRWSDIAKLIFGRSENSVKNHWNTTLRRKVDWSQPSSSLRSYMQQLGLLISPEGDSGTQHGAANPAIDSGTHSARALLQPNASCCSSVLWDACPTLSSSADEPSESTNSELQPPRGTAAISRLLSLGKRRSDILTSLQPLSSHDDPYASLESLQIPTSKRPQRPFTAANVLGSSNLTPNFPLQLPVHHKINNSPHNSHLPGFFGFSPFLLGLHQGLGDLQAGMLDPMLDPMKPLLIHSCLSGGWSSILSSSQTCEGSKQCVLPPRLETSGESSSRLQGVDRRDVGVICSSGQDLLGAAPIAVGAVPIAVGMSEEVLAAQALLDLTCFSRTLQSSIDYVT